MSFILNDNTGLKRELLEPDNYVARCYGIIITGTEFDQRFGKAQTKLIILWELPTVIIDVNRDGETLKLPKGQSATYTMSMNEKANLRKTLERQGIHRRRTCSGIRYIAHRRNAVSAEHHPAGRTERKHVQQDNEREQTSVRLHVPEAGEPDHPVRYHRSGAGSESDGPHSRVDPGAYPQIGRVSAQTLSR